MWFFLLIKKKTNLNLSQWNRDGLFPFALYSSYLNYMATQFPGMGHNSAEYLHSLSESFKLSFADTTWFCADMSQIEVPVSELLSKDYAVKRRSQIKPDRWTLCDNLHDLKNDAVYHRMPIATLLIKLIIKGTWL